MFWKRYTKPTDGAPADPAGLFTEIRVAVRVTPQLAAACLLYRAAHTYDEDDPQPAGLHNDNLDAATPDQMRDWAASRTARQLREAVTGTAIEAGVSEGLHLTLVETHGWSRAQLEAATEGVARATVDDETWATLFGEQQ